MHISVTHPRGGVVAIVASKDPVQVAGPIRLPQQGRHAMDFLRKSIHLPTIHTSTGACTTHITFETPPPHLTLSPRLLCPRPTKAALAPCTHSLVNVPEAQGP